jgi:sortase A
MNKNWKKVALLLVIVGLGWLLFQTFPEGPAPKGVGSSFEVPGVPLRLKIPSIGVNANVKQVGLNKNGDMGVTESYDEVGWYKLGPRPGASGSAVIAGHYDGKDTPRAVFYDLEKLKKGDIVEVFDQDGKVFQFKVKGMKVYDFKDSAPEVFNTVGDRPILNLITCAGDWLPSHKMYNKRVVVFTELVE